MNMNIGFHNFAMSSPFAAERNSNNISGESLRQGSLSPRQRRHIQQREVEREREMRMREMEKKRIDQINAEMDRVRESEDMEEYAKRLMLVSLGRQIGQIHINRQEREQLAVEREMKRQQAEMEERMREQEERMREQREANRPDPQTEEELQQAIANETTRGMTMISANVDNIRTLSHTRARLSAEATRLENEAGTSQTRQEVWSDRRYGMALAQMGRDKADLEAVLNCEYATDEHVRAAMATFAGRMAGAAASVNPDPYSLLDGYHGRQISDLNTRIARLDVAILSEVSAMYRESQNMQEEQLRLSQTDVTEEGEENYDDAHTPIDIQL
jgi:hypothetical protein